MEYSLSKYNIFSKLKGSENWFLVNLLSGQADILSPEKAAELKSGRLSDLEECLEKGYLVDPAAEEARYRESYKEFIARRDRGEVQIFFVPSYDCNFSCSYCYQDGYESSEQKLSTEIIDSFFAYLEREFSGRPHYITIFGGEPLLPGEHSKKMLAYLLEEAKKRGIGTAIVTNGYHLKEYLPILEKGIIREVQVTLDGLEGLHNKRRPLKGGKGTFSAIVEGIEGAIEAKLPVNLRVVIDRENIDELPALADFAIERGWTEKCCFKTQLGRNYELHFCQEGHERLFSRLEMYEALYELIKEYPRIVEFHRPAFSISRFLFENGELPEPLFDSCPGCKGEWAFDYSGRIYSCTATVGKQGEELGRFYPELSIDTEKAAQWQERDVTTIEDCRDCELQLACGGGCASVALNNRGMVKAPDCRPVKELMELGLSLYFEEE